MGLELMGLALDGQFIFRASLCFCGYFWRIFIATKNTRNHKKKAKFVKSFEAYY